MKKLLALVTAVAVLFGMTAGGALGAKPADNHAGAVKYGWHLSGDVMPVPPYGCCDIQGSDTASKLIVNQPNGKVLANLTGVMKGLEPSTEYTVFVSNVYTPYVFLGWNLTGLWSFEFEYLGGIYTHNVTLSGQTGGPLSGAGSSGGYTWAINSGSVGVDTMNFTAPYLTTLDAVGSTLNVNGDIGADGTISGNWNDNYPNPPGTPLRTGLWESVVGVAAKVYTGDLGYPGLLPEVSSFTFTTDAYGSGSWHLNLRAANVSLPQGISVWINGNGGNATILISDPVQLY